MAIATYYGDELNQAIVRYFRRFDIEGIVMGGLQTAGKDEALYTTSLQALDEVSHAQVYSYCKQGFLKMGRAVDGIYINGGGWDAVPAVNPLEADLGTKVVFALAAEMWLTYRKLAVDLHSDACGQLLRNRYQPPAR